MLKKLALKATQVGVGLTFGAILKDELHKRGFREKDFEFKEGSTGREKLVQLAKNTIVVVGGMIIIEAVSVAASDLVEKSFFSND